MILKALVVVLLCGPIVALCECSHDENPLVTTPLGKLKGTLLTSRLGKTIFAFRGIPYAKPPIEELRFQLPKGIKNPKRPVIVFILPGGFYSTGSASYRIGPQYFMDQHIVLVTFNYRLGTLGFLSTGTKEAPGNNGLKDQVQILKWVKQNIAAFGGDPDKVTILGYSAGSRSVYLHLTSPMSQGLFHRAIAMSGSPLGAWPLPKNQLEIAKKQARFVGCPEDTPSNIVKCLKTVPAEKMADSLSQFREFLFDPILIWSPVLEEDFGQERFVTDEPIKLIQSGKFNKVPLITGITSNEFDVKAFGVVNNQTALNEINSEWERIAPIAFVYERGTEKSKKISRELKKFYFNDKPIDKSQFTNLANLYSDGIVGFAINRAAKLMAQYSDAPVYYYRFSYQGRYSHYYTPESNNTIPYGVIHHDDLIYLFYLARLFPYFNASDPEVKMVSKLTTLHANFAKTGKPISTPTELLDNVSWEPFTLKNQKYLDIGNKLVMHEKLRKERYAEWEKLYPLS